MSFLGGLGLCATWGMNESQFKEMVRLNKVYEAATPFFSCATYDVNSTKYANEICYFCKCNENFTAKIENTENREVKCVEKTMKIKKKVRKNMNKLIL